MSYRKIWEEAFGPIPLDESGRTFEIHHINGDHYDNRLENLLCVSIDEHYEIHLSQGDLQAAAAIAQRMSISPETQAELNRLCGLEAVRQKRGIHALSSEERLANSIKGGEGHRGYKWYNNGATEVQSARSPGPGWALGRTCTTCGYNPGIKLGTFWNNGTINVRAEQCPGDEWVRGKLLTEEQRARRSEIAKSQTRTQECRDKVSAKLRGRMVELVVCPHCQKEGGRSAMHRWHFDNCKENQGENN